jgi:sulfite reductase (NADPH) flavoprotein alpha-component
MSAQTAPQPAMLQTILQEAARATQALWNGFVTRIHSLGLIKPTEKTFAQRQKETGYSSIYHGAITASHAYNPGGEKPFQHVEITSRGIGRKVEPGDYIGIFPENDASEAQIILRLAGLNGNEEVNVTSRHPGWNDTSVIYTDHMNIRDALALKIDLVTPGMKLLELLASREVANLPEMTIARQRALRELLASGDEARIDTYRKGNMLKDVLAAFHGIPVTAQELVDTREQLDQRRFTIAGVDGDRLSIIVSPIEYHKTTVKLVEEDPVRVREMEGVANRFLRNSTIGQGLDFYIDPSHFGLPWKAREHGKQLNPLERRAAMEADMIFIGPGTGVAPYIPMMEALYKQGHTGKNWLITGNRTRKDMLCVEQLETLRDKGALDKISFAASREGARQYVQDIVRDEGAEIWQKLNRGAYIYICGDRVMGQQVQDALEDIAKTHGNLSEDDAKAWKRALEKTGRLQVHTYRQSMEFERAA